MSDYLPAKVPALGKPTYPLCPSCHEVSGVPTAVLAGHGNITTTFRCPRCTHSWTTTEADGDVEPLNHDHRSP
jgi:hypothetical protein